MKKALQFLQKHVDVAFATCSDNLPKLRVFRIMKQEDSVLYFATSAQKAVYRELKQNPHVELLASEGDISVRCSGTVCFDVDEATKRWIYEHNNVLSRDFTTVTTKWNISTCRLPRWTITTLRPHRR